MPWVPSDAKRHVKGLSQHQATIWARVANSMLDDCLKKGGARSSCEGRAIAGANAVAKRSGKAKANHLITIHTSLTAPARTMTHHGDEYLVVDCVMAIAGVLNGGLLTTEALVPLDWNGVPVVASHPKDEDGAPCSARVPHVLERCGMGHVFHARLGEGRRRNDPVPSLVSELWLNRRQATRCGGEALQALRQLERGEPVECSTAFFSEGYLASGEFAGEPYAEVYTRVRPDHLALLPNDIGACSLEHGCGAGAVRINQSTLRYETDSPCACADPSQCTCHEGDTPMADPSPTRLARMWQVLKDLVTHADEPDDEAPPAAVSHDAQAVSDAEAALRERLLRCLFAEMGTETLPVTIHAIDPETKSCVYEIAETCYQRYWDEQDGVLSFAADPDQLDLTAPLPDVPAPEPFVDPGDMVDDKEEMPAMATHEKTLPLMVKTRVNRLIANGKHTGWTELDRGRLEAMDEATLLRLESLPQAAEPPPPPDGPVTMEAALRALGVDQDDLDAALYSLPRTKARKTKMIETILAHKNNPFPEAHLRGMRLEDLENLVLMAGEELPDTEPKTLVAQQYAGRRQPTLRVVNTEDEDVPPTPKDMMGLIVEEQRRLGLRTG